MTEQEIAIKLNDHDHEIKSLKHRTNELEEQQKEFSSLVRSVDKLANNMEVMLKEQREHKTEIDNLKKEPAESFKYYKRLIIACIITEFIAAGIVLLLKL